MYYTYFVTFGKDKARTDTEALDYMGIHFGGGTKCYGRLGSRWVDTDWFNTHRNLSIFSKTTPVDSPVTVLTDGLYDEFIKVFEMDGATAKWIYTDLDNEKPCRRFVGEKWFAVLDAHLA